MKIQHTNFKGVIIFKSPVHKDNRGVFRETFKKKFFSKTKFVFSCTSISKKNVLRGFHLQTKYPQGKYISVVKGEVLDAALDLRKKSKTFGKTFIINLSDKNGISLYIPEGFAHGFIGLKKENIMNYHFTQYRSKNHEVGILWNDDDINIKWPIRKPLVSLKDKKNLLFKEYIKKYG